MGNNPQASDSQPQEPLSATGVGHPLAQQQNPMPSEIQHTVLHQHASDRPGIFHESFFDYERD